MADNGSFSIRPATREDIPAMVQILYRAFGSNNTYAAFWPESRKHLRVLPGPGDHIAWRSARLERLFKDSKPWMHCIVAVQLFSTGEEVIVGCAEWMAPAEHVGCHPEKYQGSEGGEMELPAGIDKAAVKESMDFNKNFEESLDQALGVGRMKTMWWANSIAVDPSYQGRKIGTMLASWGVNMAEQNGTGVYLLASAAGASLYKKLGFTVMCEGEKFGEKQFAMAKVKDL